MRKEAALLCLLALAAGAGRAFAEAGRTAAPFLNAPAGARSAALGQAFTAVRGGAESLNYNPGAPAFAEGYSVTASYLGGFAGSGQAFAAAPLNFGRLTLTPGFMSFDAGDIRLNLTGETPRTVKAASDTAIYASAAWRAAPRLGLGATLKRVRLELAETASASATLGDFGALYDAGHGFSLGAALMNSGGRFTFEEAGDPAPAVRRLGAAWRSELDPPNLLDPSADLAASEVQLSADYIRPRREGGYWQAGAELAMLMSAGLSVSLRAGWLFGRPAEGLTFGFGFGGKKFSLDFAFDTGRELNARKQAGATWRF